MKYVIGNWKMNSLKHRAREDAGSETLLQALDRLRNNHSDVTAIICPNALDIYQVKAALGGNASSVHVGGQDCLKDDVAEEPGKNRAQTGDTSALMLKNKGCEYVITGHSERRAGHAETNEDVRRKAEAAIANGLTPVICVGETLEQRKAGEEAHDPRLYLDPILRQVKESLPEKGSVIVAYEPVWAIGSGKTPTLNDIKEVHNAIAQSFEGGIVPPILYGGSVSDKNAQNIMALPHVDGVLVGGASLDVDKFQGIIEAAHQVQNQSKGYIAGK